MESNDKQTVFIVDTYSHFDNNEDVCMVFSLYNKWYCIREIQELEWGKPIFKEKGIEEDPYYYLYSSLEDAKAFVRQLKRLEGARY